jgi:hypothetical protein
MYIGRPREYDSVFSSLKPDIAIITVGAKDAAASIAEGRTRHPFGSPRWREIYVSRIDALLERLKKANVAIYWVGLPIMRDPKFNENMNALNDIFRERTHHFGVKFIDSWNGFVDQYGNFSLYGPDLEGRTVRLRDKDGIRFTAAGYLKLANYVEREIRRDLIAARSERNIPLAGNEEEQKRIGKRGKKNGKTALGRRGKNKIMSARAAGSASAYGETIAADRSSGLTLLSSISRIHDPSLSGTRHTLPLTLRPYYRVLVKGEALSPKPGRSDDFTWRKKTATGRAGG